MVRELNLHKLSNNERSRRNSGQLWWDVTVKCPATCGSRLITRAGKAALMWSGAVQQQRAAQLIVPLVCDRSAESQALLCFQEREARGSKDRSEGTSGLSQGLMVFFTADLLNWHLPALWLSWTLSPRSAHHRERTAKVPTATCKN